MLRNDQVAKATLRPEGMVGAAFLDLFTPTALRILIPSTSPHLGAMERSGQDGEAR